METMTPVCQGLRPAGGSGRDDGNVCVRVKITHHRPHGLIWVQPRWRLRARPDGAGLFTEFVSSPQPLSSCSRVNRVGVKYVRQAESCCVPGCTAGRVVPSWREATVQSFSCVKHQHAGYDNCLQLTLKPLRVARCGNHNSNKEIPKQISRWSWVQMWRKEERRSETRLRTPSVTSDLPYEGAASLCKVAVSWHVSTASR